MAYTVTVEMPLNMPTPGTREPAAISLLNQNCVVISPHDHTTGKGVGVGRMRSGLQANRPAASSAGNVYFATDTGRFYADTGTAWVGFITEGGSATVTGWTLVDPVIRDTLQFGPEGSGTIDNFLSRTGANALRTDSNLGVGVAPAAWAASQRVLNMGQSVALWGGAANVGGALGDNTYYDGTNFRAVVAGAASYALVANGAAQVVTAPSVAAGAAQTFTTRLTVAQNGMTTLSSEAGINPLLLNSGGAAGTDAAMVGYQQQGVNRWFTGVASAGAFTLSRGSDFVVKASVAQTGTVTLTPDAGQAALSVTGPIYTTAADSLRHLTGNMTIGANNHILINAAAGHAMYPVPDNSISCGHTSFRWTYVAAVAGTIQTSSMDAKENVHDLDPDLALAAVLNTPVFLFNYKSPPPPDPLPEGYEPTPQFEHAGYDAATADPLLVMDDQSVNAQNTSSVVIAALQALSAKVDELRSRLEATSGQAPAA